MACVFGCAGTRLTAEEAAFFRDAKPWGFILFARNIETLEQTRALADDLRNAVGRAGAPVMADQEGGRVQRLGPPRWRRYPPAGAYAASRLSADERREAVQLAGRLVAEDLREATINVNCAPVADTPGPGAHGVIGDRAYAETPDLVAELAGAAAAGLIAGGVAPVVKHLPGHGRADADSHHELPRVDAGLAELEASDFIPFRALADLPLGLTAHVAYQAFDPGRPATTSAIVIREAIRGAIGFKGLLLSDDLAMRALPGSLTARAAAALGAGCDVVLYGGGDRSGSEAVAVGARDVDGGRAGEVDRRLREIADAADSIDIGSARRRFDHLLRVGGLA